MPACAHDDERRVMRNSGLAASFSGRGAAPPAGAASRARAQFHRARPVRPRGRRRSADQPGRALDRLCPPLRRHHDRPLPPRRSGWSTPPAAGRCRSRRGASQPRWSPDGDRLAYIAAAEGGARAALRALDGDRQAVPITGLPDLRRRASPGRRTGARSPMRCSCPTKARGSARRSRGPKARNGPSRCR